MSDKAIAREEFETAYKAIVKQPILTMGRGYECPFTQEAWELWQAAKEHYAPRWISAEDENPPHGVRCLFMERGTEHVISSFPHKRIWEEQGHDLWMLIPQLGDKA